jgi:REP element-mobilizing transposase RayT
MTQGLLVFALTLSPKRELLVIVWKRHIQLLLPFTLLHLCILPDKVHAIVVAPAIYIEKKRSFTGCIV